MLAHNPGTARRLPGGHGLLCLSGHTHGGQVYVPGLTAYAMERFAHQHFVRGSYDVGGNQLYVNRGIGSTRAPVPRINSTPELTVFTLKRKAPSRP